jgi:hypothetical protein
MLIALLQLTFNNVSSSFLNVSFSINYIIVQPNKISDES